MSFLTRLSLTVSSIVLTSSHCFGGDTAKSNVPKTVQNATFVVTAPTLELASEVLAQAERWRDQIAEDWLGERIPPSIGPTIINVRIGDLLNEAHTWPSSDPRRPTFMMWVRASTAKATGPLLAHELTHVVLLTRYPDRMPPWANEGIASLQDDSERKAIVSGILKWYVRTGTWPELASILNAPKFYATDQASYAAANSLVEFLLTRGDRATLLECAIRGSQEGWGSAFRDLYHFESLQSLQEDWQTWVAAREEKNQAGDNRVALRVPRAD